ncbi:MAG: PAS domain-containing protein [Gammaproteobacteria bacterium]|nr:PAS domain-containing protein [Gammaproteobacteria bacterium]MBU1353811.1 PAS domain-containing protein [Gammaproteobacteria bacterium]MBU1506215.1 PAS domain-containing protein [Gammaproteobacteria bacterium]MBU2122918.1 PAS domain-containing protein [Gammaproteobacteria bacterium]MBU2169388.1 PAS domain-containing protein [Gammaproteobacteria bacterium]
MSAKVRDHDWASTPLGGLSQWPPALRFAVETMLSSRFPSCLIWGPEHTMLYNEAYQPLMGSKPEALGRPLSEVWSESWPALKPMVDKAYAGEATFIEDFELETTRFGKLEQAYFTFCYSPLRDESGQVRGMLNTVVETTSKFLALRQTQKLAASLEEQVAERTADRNRLWQLSEDVLLVARYDGAITAVNPAWTATLGWSEEETIGHAMAGFAHADDKQEVAKAMTQLAIEPQRRQIVARYRHRDGGERWIAWTAVPSDGFIQAVGRDTTEEHLREQALHNAEERLRQSQKMEAVGQLTGGIAHDFNNMLQGIVLPLQIIRQRMAQGRYDEVGRYIDSGLAAAKRAAGLTQRLLAFSRRQPLDSRPVDLGASLSGLESMLKTTCGENIALQLELPQGLWPALTDANQFESAVVNLAINARDAMPTGGALHISAANVQADAAMSASIPGLEPGDYVCITVRDTGTGMPGDVVARAFDPFFTTKPLGQGTGLGLSMIYGFMRQSGGIAVLDSTVGQGTAVALYFMRSRHQEAEAAPTEALTSLSGARRPDSILVVEDDDTVRALAVELLRDMGFQVMEAATGSAAMALLSGAVHFDLLVSDVGLPGPNGRQVADYAREQFPSIKIILMTGYAEQAAMTPQFLGAHMELLVKPFDAQALVAKVHAAMGQGSA